VEGKTRQLTSSQQSAIPSLTVEWQSLVKRAVRPRAPGAAVAGGVVEPADTVGHTGGLCAQSRGAETASATGCIVDLGIEATSGSALGTVINGRGERHAT
jgi:hypothetical protein